MKNLEPLIIISLGFVLMAGICLVVFPPFVNNIGSQPVVSTTWVSPCMKTAYTCGFELYRLDKTKLIPGEYIIIVPFKTVVKNAQGEVISNTVGEDTVIIEKWDSVQQKFVGTYKETGKPFSCSAKANIFKAAVKK